MYIILSQRIDIESTYSDELFKMYHYPSKYRNQIRAGDIFVYYQGDRLSKEHRYYYGTGEIARIVKDDTNDTYYAELSNCKRFNAVVPIYLGDGYVEQKDFASVRKSQTPPWQSSVRPLSKEAYDFIVFSSNGMTDEGASKNVERLKTELKSNIREFYIYDNNNAILDVIKTAKKIATELHIDINEQTDTSKYLAHKTEIQFFSREDLFEYCTRMKMSYSYKPLLLKAVLSNCDSSGKISLITAVEYFKKFYNTRRRNGLTVEKKKCIYLDPETTDEKIATNILTNPLKVLRDANILEYNEDKSTIGFTSKLWEELIHTDKDKLVEICNLRLSEYYFKRS